jgi:tetratricopeptide (TPR) repeat protein
MIRNLAVLLFNLLVLTISSSAPGQTAATPTDKPTAPGLIKLTGEDEKRAKQLDEQIDKALKEDHWDEAIARAGELLALRSRVQGPKHFDTVDAEWRLKAMRRVALMPHEDQVAYQSANAMHSQGKSLFFDGKYAEAQPLFDRALRIRCRLLTDDHPDTARSYHWMGYTMDRLGKFALAQPLFEKALGYPSSPPHRRTPRYEQQLRWRGVQPLLAREILPSSALVREVAGNQPTTAHREPRRH